ncbi:MAG: hypothetical protein M0Z58_08650, partial [Nitrospiraceae bacterium]|nr:hypothetical protein [Nitrospiraceae bacterium]
SDLNTYGKLTGASSFDQAASGFFATMGTMGGAQTAGQKAGLEATGPDGSGLAFKTQREMENEYEKFRMLDAVARAQGMAPMEFLAAHHGNISFADSRTGGIDTTTMSADGKTLMSTHRAQMSGEKLRTFAQALDQEGMSGTAKELDKLSAQGKPVDLSWATDGAGMLTSFQAASGGEVFQRDFSNVKRGREVLSENLNKTLAGTRIDTGLREETGAKVINDQIDETHIGKGTVIDSTASQMALNGDTSLVHGISNPYLDKNGRKAAIMAVVDPWAKNMGAFLTRTGVSLNYTKGDAQVSASAGVGTGRDMPIFHAGVNTSATGSVGGAREDKKQYSLLATRAADLLQNTYSEAEAKGLNREQTDRLMAEKFQDYTSALQTNALAARAKNYGASAGPATAEEAAKKLLHHDQPGGPINDPANRPIE